MTRPQAARMIHRAHMATTRYAWGAGPSVNAGGATVADGYELAMDPHAPGTAPVRRPLRDEESLIKFDILRQMWKRESQLPQLLDFSKDEKRERRIVVEWMLNLCDEFGFNLITAGLAVAILDALIQKGVFNGLNKAGSMHLLGSCSVAIAAKYHEAEVDVPPLTKFVLYSHGSFTLEDMTKMEIFILEQMTWNISSFVTPAHFLDYLFDASDGAIYPETDQMTINLEVGDLANLMQRFVLAFHCFSIKDSIFRTRFLPSKVAAAVIYASRVRLRLHPVWPADLAQLSSFTAESLFDCVHHLLYALEENNRLSGNADPSAAQGGHSDSTECVSSAVSLDGMLVPQKTDDDRVDSPCGPFDRPHSRPGTSGTDSSGMDSADDCVYECLEEDPFTGKGERMVLDNFLACMEDPNMSQKF